MAQFKLPGGVTLTLPDDLPIEDLNQVLTEALPDTMTAANIARQALGQGAAMGLGDEIVGGVRGSYDAATTDATLPEAYVKHRDAERAANKAFEGQYPKTAFGLQLGGGLATGGYGGARALGAKGLGTLAKVGRTAGTGAVLGGAGGFGYGEGDFAKQGFQTALGATAGGALGMLAPGVVALWKSKPIRAAMARIMPRGASNQAKAKILEGITRDARAQGITKLDDAITYAERRLNEMPGGAIAGDIGPNMRGITTAVGNTPGAGRTMVEQTLVNRQMNRPNRLLSIVSSVTGQKGKPIDTLEDIIQHRKTVGGKMYREAFEDAAENGTTVDVSGLRQHLVGLTKMASESNKSIYNKVLREFYDEVKDHAGRKQDRLRMGLEELHGVKEGIDTIIAQLKRSGASGKVLGEVNDIKTALTERLKGASEKYAKGWETYVDDYAQQRALESGVSIFDRVKALKPDAIAGFDKMSGHEREMFKIGVAAKIEEMVLNGQTTRAIRQMLNTPAIKVRLQKVFGRDYDGFVNRMEGEMQMMATENATLAGSRTTPLMKEIENLTGAVDIAVNAGRAVSGDLRAAATLVDKARLAASGPPARVAEEMAPYITEAVPENLRRMLLLKKFGARGGSTGTGVLAGSTVGGGQGVVY